MNMFDRLLKIVLDNKRGKIASADADTALDALRNARLFHLEETVNIPLSQTATMDELVPDFTTVTSDQLLLPFKVTALVHPDSVLILFKVETNLVEHGFACIGATRLLANYSSEGYIVYFGAIGVDDILNGHNVKSSVSACYITVGSKLVPMIKDTEVKEFCECLALRQLYDLASINTLDRFIVEVAPSDKHPVKSSKYIPKSHQRPEYIILHPKEIRKMMRLPEVETGEHKTRSAHERRAHLRRYPDDKERWPNMAGKTIKIEAVWIGPTTAEFDGKQYKVILD